MEPIKIGNFEINQSDVDAMIASFPPEQQKMYSGPMFVEQIIQTLKERAMFAAMAEEMGLEETESYKKSMEIARRDILSQIGIHSVLAEAKVTDDEAKEYYENNKKQYVNPERAAARHILVDTEEKANEIKSDIEAGKVSFADAARMHSSCPSSANGGDLGEFARGQMVPEFDEVVFTAPIGDLSDPVKTQFGYHIVQVTDRADADQQPYEAVEDEIKRIMLEDKRNGLYDEKMTELLKKYGK